MFKKSMRVVSERAGITSVCILSRRRLFSLVAVVLFIFVCAARFSQAGAPVKLRINTRHGIENAQGAVNDAGLSLTTQISVTASSEHNGHPYLPPDRLLADGLAHGATILSSSFSGWNFLYDSAGYQELTDGGVVHVYAYEPQHPQPLQAPPPAVFVTVNKIGGTTGGGIEFGVPTTYMNGKGKSSTPSGVTAQLAGLMACLKYRHPSWNWFDVKAALRATASNFATGYDPHTYGYGVIDYQAANALADAEKLPLFGPATVAGRLAGDRLVFRINAFKQRRRFTDVLFKFPSRPSPLPKELTLKEITAMGGSYLFSSYLSREPSSWSYRLSPLETVYFVWFTQDGHGNYSRIESYSILGPFTGNTKGVNEAGVPPA
ncbi:MAG: hypothetical protein HXX11_14360 [Desulfuromonadales bacterium]|nr:hypothetical protein [Desulfuromonadales bacterium]